MSRIINTNGELLAYLCSPSEINAQMASGGSIKWTPASDFRAVLTCPSCGSSRVASNGRHRKPKTGDDGCKVIHYLPRFICHNCTKTKGKISSFILYPPDMLPYTSHSEQYVLYAVERRKNNKKAGADRTHHMQPRDHETRLNYQRQYLSMSTPCRGCLRLERRFSDLHDETLKQRLNRSINED